MLLRLAVLDVNETLFDLEPLGGRLESVGGPRAPRDMVRGHAARRLRTHGVGLAEFAERRLI